MNGQFTVTVFTQMFTAFDQNLLGFINTGSAAIISLISPVCGTLFAIYLLFITAGYWKGGIEEPVTDFLMRMIGWAAIIAFGLNIQYYSTYVVPFFNGLGDDLATALTGTPQTGSALDALCTAYVTAMWKLFQAADGIEDTLNAICFIAITLLAAVPFIAIAAAYIILAKFALSILLALGPLFFAFAIFPPTRKFFDAWVGQCMNYTFLVCLFAAAGMLEIRFAQTMVPTSMTLLQLFQLVMMGVAFIVISLNLPGLASQLGGGVGISSMVGKASGLASALKAVGKGAGGGDKGGSGGSISGSGGGGGGSGGGSGGSVGPDV
jgi:type IV secretion system protein VirB6